MWNDGGGISLPPPFAHDRVEFFVPCVSDVKQRCLALVADERV